MNRLLVMSCSEAKHVFPSPRPAFEVYQGPAFQVVRRYVKEHDGLRPPRDRTPHLSFAAPGLHVLILSAKYGPIPWGKMIEHYDVKLTKEQAKRERERGEWSAMLRAYGKAIQPSSAFVYGGTLYKLCVPVKSWQPDGCPVELSIGGIGEQLHQLKVWLEGCSK